MALLSYLIKRLITIAFSLVVITAITYCLMYAAPGNFFDIARFQNMSNSQSSMNQENIELLRRGFEKKYGLDQPLWKQVLIYLQGAIRFQFGPAFSNPTNNIEDLIRAKFPVTLTLGLSAIALAILIGIPLGILAAIKRNTWLDYTATLIAMIGQVIPSYVIAVLMIILFSVTLAWLPTSGWGTPSQMVLPVISVALGPMAMIARFMRVSLLDTLNQDYIRTVYAKGGTDRAAIMKHALRNSLIPIVTVIGPTLAFILAGSTVFVENIFRVPGIGQLFINAATFRDYPLLVTSTFVLSLTIMLMNLLVDLVYAMLDPRIKLK